MANKENESEDIQIHVYAILTIIGNMILILTFLRYRDWANTMPSAKNILFVQCTTELIGALMYTWTFHGSDTLCAFQAFMVQVFWVGSAAVNGILGIEMAYLCRKIFLGSARRGSNLARLNDKNRMWYRYTMYFTPLVIYFFAVAIWLVEEEEYGPTSFDGRYCWLKTSDERLYFGYIPYWLAISANTFSAIYVIFTIYSEYVAIGRTGPSTHIFDVIKKFSRLFSDCVLFIILRVPGSIRRGSAGKLDSQDLQRIHYFGITYGFWKFVIWVLLDPKVQGFWLNALYTFLGCPERCSPVKDATSYGRETSIIEMRKDMGNPNPLHGSGREEAGGELDENCGEGDSDDEALFDDLENRATIKSSHSAKNYLDEVERGESSDGRSTSLSTRGSLGQSNN